MDSSDEEYFASSVTIHFISNKNREFAVHPINRNRRRDGEFHRLYPDLRKYPEKFRSYTRMSMETFDMVLSFIESRLMKNWTNLNREPIYPCERLIVTLRYLATGSSFQTLGFSFRMGRPTVADIVRETCQMLWKALQPIYMPFPTQQMFLHIASEFWATWNFPHCIGCIDGKHIRIKCPGGSGSMAWNYKGFHSLVLQAVADSNYRFLAVDVGGWGQQSDGGTFSASDFYEHMQNGTLNIPPDAPLPDPDLNTNMPFVFVGDEAYPLMRNVLRPYPRSQLDQSKEYFNARLSRARKCVECAFGIMTAKWRILWKPIETGLDLADDIVKAMCILHNVVIDHEGVDTLLEESAEHATVQLPTRTIQEDNSYKICTKTGRYVREYFTKFVNKNKIG